MNTIDANLWQWMLAAIFQYLRKETTLLTLLLKEPLEEAIRTAKKGTIIQLPIPSPFTNDAHDVVPGPTPPATAPLVLANRPLTLDQWKEESFTMTNLDITRLTEGQGLQSHMTGALDVVARTAVKYVFNLMDLGAYNYVGTAGVTPFGSGIQTLADARKLLKKAGAAKEGRAAILNFDAEANIINLDKLTLTTSRRDQGYFTLSTGEITSQLFGMTIGTDAYAPTHTRGTINTLTPLINGAVAAGATTAIFDAGTLTGTLVVGDRFKVGTDDQGYVVTALATAAANAITVTFSPAIPTGKSFADNAQVTIADTHDCNFFLHQHAVGFASRPTDTGPRTGFYAQMRDDLTGLAYSVEMISGNAQTMVYIRSLYGATVTRPELLGVIAG